MAELSFCLVTTFYPPSSFGGDGAHVARLARGLADRGHRVRVVHNPAAFRMLAPRGTSVDAPADGAIEVVAAPAESVGTIATQLTGRPLGYRRAMRELLDGFDVVHFHNPSLLGGPGAFGAGDGIRVYTTHEHWLVCPTHVLFRYQREVCTTRTCVRCQLRYGRPPQLWRWGSVLERGVDQLHALLSPSRFTADIHRRHFPRTRVEVLPLPAPEIRDVGAAAPPATRPYFLYAGRLEPVKGVDRLVSAFPGVRGADLVIAGEGSTADRLRDLARGCDAIRFVGLRTPDEVLALCRDALAVVVPSSGYETFGGVAIEAMAMGTPAVVRDLGPLPELVEGGGGLTFADDDDLVDVLQRLVDDPTLGPALGRRATQVVAERYSPERFFARYFEILEDLAAVAGLDPVRRRVAAARSGGGG